MRMHVVFGIIITLLSGQVEGRQAVRGTLLGNVTDQSGLPMAGVTVTAVEVNTNIASVTSTNESGAYTFSLKDGQYRVDGQRSGFKRAVRTGIDVPVNATVRVDVTLEVGDVQESVLVVAAAPLLQTDRADTGRAIDAFLVQQVPLSFNRNFQSILVTVPGATRPFRPHSEFFNSQDSLSTNVNGQSRLANSVQLEGVDDNHKTGLLTVLIPSADAIESVSVTTSSYDAEFGRAGGAITNVTLKSGTNTLKGSVVAFGNTEATMASGWPPERAGPRIRGGLERRPGLQQPRGGAPAGGSSASRSALGPRRPQRITCNFFTSVAPPVAARTR